MAITDALPEMKRELKFFPADRTKASTLTHEQVDDFNEKGFLCPVEVITGDEVERNRAYFDYLMELAVDAGLNSYSINGWHSSCAGLYDLVTNVRILDAVEDLIGPNLVCTMSHFFCKMPDDPKQVSWHQDASYWPLTAEQSCDRMAGDR